MIEFTVYRLAREYWTLSAERNRRGEWRFVIGPWYVGFEWKGRVSC